MFAIAFDLKIADVEALHPSGFQSAYAEVGATLRKFDFRRVQGSVYLTDNDSLANLTAAMTALKTLTWFPACVRDIRAFRVENWSDFTDFIKQGAGNQ